MFSNLFKKVKGVIIDYSVDALARTDPAALYDLLKANESFRKKFWDFVLSDTFKEWLPESKEILYETSWPEAILTFPMHPKTQFYAAMPVTSVAAIFTVSLFVFAGLAAVAGAVAMTSFLLAFTVVSATIAVAAAVVAYQASDTAEKANKMLGAFI